MTHNITWLREEYKHPHCDVMGSSDRVDMCAKILSSQEKSALCLRRGVLGLGPREQEYLSFFDVPPQNVQHNVATRYSLLATLYLTPP
jgi:hypothetical protein